MIYVDSNVILDMLNADPVWRGWSGPRLEEGRLHDALVCGPVVAAEVAHYLDSVDILAASLARLQISCLDVDLRAAWFAGQAYRDYRQRGGERPSLLPDFLIGGHALSLGATLLTRDARRYRAYFPALALITPEETA